MTNLITEGNKGVIIFFDKSKIFINENEMEQLKQIEGSKFTIKGNIYNFTQVFKILYLNEYYKEYPDSRPAQTTEFEREYIKPADRTREQRIRAMESMKQGMMDCVNRDYKGIPTIKIQQMIDNADKRIEHIQNLIANSPGNHYNDISIVNNQSI